MGKLERLLYMVWPWTFTVITGSLIVWLTLGQPPMPDEKIPLWEHTDKIVHACMFGGLFYAAALDWYRRRPDVAIKRTSPVMWKIAVCCAIAGGAIELIQPYFGRSCDLLDFMADCAGILLAWIVFPYFIPRRSRALR